MVHVHQYLRRHVRRACLVGREFFRIDQRFRAGRNCFGHLAARELGSAGAHHRTEVGRRVQRIAELVLACQPDETIDELVVDAFVRVDAFDPAAGLPGIEISAVHKILHGMREVGIGTHVGGILAAQFEADADETLGRCVLHGMSAGDGPGECDEIDQSRGDQLRGLLVRAMQELKYAFGQPRCPETFGIALGAQGRLAGMLQDDRIAGHDRGHH